MARLVFGIAGGLLVALLAGWFWGASGRSDAARALETAELRSDLVGARAAILDARVAIYSVNFGEASQHLENARGLLRRAEERFKILSQTEGGKEMQAAFTAIDDAQRLTGKLDQSANSRAGDAAKVLADLLDAAAKR